MTVAKDLDLNVTGFFQEFLHVDGVIPEIGLGLPPCRVIGLNEMFAFPHDLHALAAAAGGRLDQNRKAHFLCRMQAVLCI